ncbi:hypothetical protein RF11_06575 [Thelohanellus kitauei]|uniref:Sortilin N-terminal domain-containing protein n=1 Tax=Thelohanellus kitauei TaxID=669202 RepID=A0A0C2NL92_THEKT|nr:hypothetical protein RF11_06575 [Thelohanellus kitauei]
MSNNYSEIFQTHANYNHFILSQSSLIIKYKKLQNQNAENLELKWNLMIWDFGKKRQVDVILPGLFQIKFLEQFNDIHGNYYIVATDFSGLTCLFNSYDKSEYFITVVCDLAQVNKHICPILIHPKLPGVILANFKNGFMQSPTYISKNNGKKFEIIQYDSNQRDCRNGFCDIKLNLPCRVLNKYHFPKEWIIFATGMFIKNEQFSMFVTFDGGQIWKSVPSSDSTVRTLNDGGIVMNVDKLTNNLFYSFDEGKTYHNMSINKEDEVILGAFIFGITKNLRLMVLGRDVIESTLIIKTINFKSLLSMSQSLTVRTLMRKT